MADTDKNKKMAGGRFGDPDFASGHLGADNKADTTADGAGVPAAAADNKFTVNTVWGDADSSLQESNPDSFTQDAKGVQANQESNKTNMDMALEPNKFPRETGHDSLSDEEVVLS